MFTYGISGAFWYAAGAVLQVLPALGCPSPCSQMLMPVTSPLSFQCKSTQTAIFISQVLLLCMIRSTVSGVGSSWCLGACQARPADPQIRMCSDQRSPSSQTYAMHPPPSACTETPSQDLCAPHHRLPSCAAPLQILLFGVMAVEIKRKAPRAHTVLELVRKRWGHVANVVCPSCPSCRPLS